MSLALQLKDYRLTTAEILYRLPDHPGILQTYVWQDLDLAPRYPVLRKFRNCPGNRCRLTPTAVPR